MHIQTSAPGFVGLLWSHRIRFTMSDDCMCIVHRHCAPEVLTLGYASVTVPTCTLDIVIPAQYPCHLHSPPPPSDICRRPSGKLNTNEENENRLGYDLYSGALADFLSEPALTVPISVGLYAKWGSGQVRSC